MRGKITKRSLDAVKVGLKDVFLWDTDLPGFGIKITSEGRRVFLLQYRMGGRGFPTRRYTIGPYGAFTVDAAREFAKDLMQRVRKGIDPMAEKAVARISTVGNLVKDFIKSRREKGRRAVDEVERMLNREVLGDWRDRPIASITAADVSRLVEAIRDRGAPATANQTLTHLKTMFAWAQRRGDIAVSPAVGVEKPAADIRRDRSHSDSELAEIWRATEHLDWRFGTAIKLLILTGQRREEVGQMRWSEIDTHRALWTLPAERTKNGLPHDIHLSKQVLAILKKTPKTKGIDLVFTTTGTTPISGWTKAKGQLDEKIAKARQAKRTGEADAVQPMPAWVIHDLRRTFATGLNDLGVMPHIADRILNHVAKKKGGVMAVYNRAEYASERRAAMDLWSDHVDRLLSGKSAKVAPPRGKRRAT